MDLTHFMNGRPIFTQPQPQVQDLQYDMVQMVGGSGMLFRSDSTTGTGSTTASLSAGGGFEMETGGGSGNGRWPRQETLTLLEVRSRLDSKFKEANQKGPLWDEVSRYTFLTHSRIIFTTFFFFFFLITITIIFFFTPSLSPSYLHVCL